MSYRDRSRGLHGVPPGTCIIVQYLKLVASVFHDQAWVHAPYRANHPVIRAPEMTESVVDEDGASAWSRYYNPPYPQCTGIQRPAASAGTHVKYLVDV